MKTSSQLANKLSNGSLVVTAELLPQAGANPDLVKEAASSIGSQVAAVNVSDNPFGSVTSSLGQHRN